MNRTREDYHILRQSWTVIPNQTLEFSNFYKIYGINLDMNKNAAHFAFVDTRDRCILPDLVWCLAFDQLHPPLVHSSIPSTSS